MTISSSAAAEQKTFDSVMKQRLHEQTLGQRRRKDKAAAEAGAAADPADAPPPDARINIWSHRLLPAARGSAGPRA